MPFIFSTKWLLYSLCDASFILYEIPLWFSIRYLVHSLWNDSYTLYEMRCLFYSLWATSLIFHEIPFIFSTKWLLYSLWDAMSQPRIYCWSRQGVTNSNHKRRIEEASLVTMARVTRCDVSPRGPSKKVKNREWGVGTFFSRPVTHVNEACRTCERVTKHVWMRHGVAHVNASCRTCECVMSHEWMRHATHINESDRVTQMNESCHTCESVKSCHTHGWVMSPYGWVMKVGRCYFLPQTCHKYERVMPYIWINQSHATNVNESWEWAVATFFSRPMQEFDVGAG